MKEEFLHFIWKHQLYDKERLTTTKNTPVQVISTGQSNSDSGPDFFNAKIKIDETVWAGNVEVHQKSSQWYHHGHQDDPAYKNVILHVVEKEDKPITIDHFEIPTIELKYSEDLLRNYEELIKSEQWISCEKRFHEIDPFQLQFWYSSLMIERLQSKTNEILTLLNENGNNWNETFYQLLARNFGMKTNALPFELLAKSIPLSILSKHKNNPFQIEALLFGQSGFLNENLLEDDYFLSLRKEYSFLYKKYRLTAIETHLWKFLRLRPINFPTIRIAQFASLVNNSSALFSKIMEASSIHEIKSMFNVTASTYWDNHYTFNKTSPRRKKKPLGETTFRNIVINTIVPVLFVYGDQQNKQNLKDLSLSLLEQLPSENNHIIRRWEMLGIKPRTAFEGQALLQLKNAYCLNKKCVNCHVGVKLISNS